MSPKLQEALDRAFPISQMGGLSGAMYPAGEGEGQGWAINNEDWEVVSGVVRELIDDPVAVIRQRVESGEVEGVKREWYCERQKRCVDTDGYQCRIGYNEAEAHPECGWHILIPASTAGEDL